LLKAILKLVNRNGEVQLEDLALEFHAFYLERYRQGLPAEFGVPLLENPTGADPTAIRRLVVRYPLDRFLIQGFLEYEQTKGVVRFTPSLWAELRFYELLEVLANADEQLRYYYSRHKV
jgi:hypothetical protein